MPSNDQLKTNCTARGPVAGLRASSGTAPPAPCCCIPLTCVCGHTEHASHQRVCGLAHTVRAHRDAGAGADGDGSSGSDEEGPPAASVHCLPPEVLEAILRNLPPVTLARACAVSRCACLGGWFGAVPCCVPRMHACGATAAVPGGLAQGLVAGDPSLEGLSGRLCWPSMEQHEMNAALATAAQASGQRAHRLPCPGQHAVPSLRLCAGSGALQPRRAPCGRRLHASRSHPRRHAWRAQQLPST